MVLDRLQLNKETLQELVKLSLPMVISQGAFAVMIFTDRYFMSQIDPVHMAAALGGGVASFFCLSLFIGILSYANALVAQYYGAAENLAARYDAAGELHPSETTESSTPARRRRRRYRYPIASDCCCRFWRLIRRPTCASWTTTRRASA